MKMSKRAETALRTSIEKWEDIVVGDEADRGTNNCALCGHYWHTWGCSPTCPVKRKTKKDGCMRSPYEEWLDATKTVRAQTGERKATTPELKKLAQKELDFLKSLLP